jgi:hypothetical protein
MRIEFASAASDLLDEDPLAAVVLAEISADLFAKAAARHPERVLNVGIREQLMVSVGGGLALAGLRPILHSYAPFLVERAFEQVKLDLAHQGARAVLVSIGASYDAARAGRTHQAPGDVALVDTVPGFAVRVPGHPDEVPGVLRGAVAALSGADGYSSYIRLSTEANRAALPVSPLLQVVRSGLSGLVIQWPGWTSRWPTPPRSGRSTRPGCGRWRVPVPWCWSSRTWPARRRTRYRLRWPGGGTGCSAWACRVPNCGVTARPPTTPRWRGWTGRACGVR